MTDRPFDLSKLSRYSLHSRNSKVTTDDFAKPVKKGMTVAEWLDGLPNILAAPNLRDLAKAIAAARKAGRPVHIGMGAHVLKVGLGPLLIDLMEKQIITGLSFNGAVLVHDYEIAAAGKTSEDVDAVLGKGQFGMAEETGRDLCRFIHRGADENLGLAGGVGRGILDGDFPHKNVSVLAQGVANNITLTCHPALGTDITHLWPDLDWGKLGAAAGRDFLTFTAMVEQMRGGVYLNIGSAVVMPEVFLKAVTAVRNIGADHTGITTANFDFLRHYRPATNVVRRPTAGVGRGFDFAGHHEIMIPLLFAAVFEEISA